MTLKEQKIAIEQSVAKKVKASLAANVDVNAAYDLENAIVNVNLKLENKSANNGNVLCYNIAFNEELKKIAISAFNRVMNYDSFGPAVVVNEPVVIDEDFMVSMKMIIEGGIFDALNPQEPEADKPAEE